MIFNGFCLSMLNIINFNLCSYYPYSALLGVSSSPGLLQLEKLQLKAMWSLLSTAVAGLGISLGWVCHGEEC